MDSNRIESLYTSLAKFLTVEQLQLLTSLESPSLEILRIFFKTVLLNNFEAFTYILGYRDVGSFHKEKQSHISNVQYLVPTTIRRLWLWARGHFKTSLITEAHSLWLIVNNPNIRLLVVSNTLEIAKKILNNVRSQFMNNEDFRYFFPEFCPKVSKEGKIEFGTTENFTVPNRTKSIKEPTMMCAGVGTNLTGLHFDYMKIDDLVTRESVSNDTQIQASKDYYSSLRQLFDNPTLPKEDVIGTTYHFADLYAGFKGSLDFEQSFVPVQNGDGTINFFERFSLDGINSIRNDPTVGPYEFNAQYMLNPINPAEAKFKDEWWKCYDTLPNGLAEHIFVDPASTQKKKSDYTVIERWGVSFDGTHYLLEGIRDKMTVFQRIDAVTAMAKRAKNLKQVKYEVLGGRHGDLESLKDRFYKEHITISPLETKATTSSKKDRIEQRLVGQFHAGKIYFPTNCFFKSKLDGKTYDFVQLYKNEFLQFPYCEHDDILDCHSQMFEGFIHLGEKVAIADKKTDEFEWWRQKAITRRKENENPKSIKYIFGKKNRISAKIPFQEAFR